MALWPNQAQAEARVREMSSVWFPGKFITNQGPGTKDNRCWVCRDFFPGEGTTSQPRGWGGAQGRAYNA